MTHCVTGIFHYLSIFILSISGVFAQGSPLGLYSRVVELGLTVRQIFWGVPVLDQQVPV
jgi:hypothetical protein